MISLSCFCNTVCRYYILFTVITSFNGRMAVSINSIYDGDLLGEFKLRQRIFLSNTSNNLRSFLLYEHPSSEFYRVQLIHHESLSVNPISNHFEHNEMSSSEALIFDSIPWPFFFSVLHGSFGIGILGTVVTQVLFLLWFCYFTSVYTYLGTLVTFLFTNVNPGTFNFIQLKILQFCKHSYSCITCDNLVTTFACTYDIVNHL